ncbi:MAG: lipoprotein-releasing system ATP-binding protein LolD [Flavobacteriaceae bacterium]|nr:lipoprotein-releasing system ATP-binding protein LolD [Flavobacteriaceae bacterium]|tara:strand:- start:2861 stop:3532 length:672 start_codon:yes stop_codon:yes gene_type:complete
MEPLLKAVNISKNYNALSVLKSIDLEIDKQEIVTILGPSGAGKTTLLHILGTLDKPNSNYESKLYFNGINTSLLAEKELSQFRNQNIGFIFQFHELLPEFTALENICLPTWISNSSSIKVKEKALGLLERLGIKDRANHKPTELSGGEQQRVAVARALINEPKIIFADEPSGNLDTENANQLHDLFFELRDEKQCSFVIVTHNKELAKRADRRIRIIDGKIKM